MLFQSTTYPHTFLGNSLGYESTTTPTSFCHRSNCHCERKPRRLSQVESSPSCQQTHWETSSRQKEHKEMNMSRPVKVHINASFWSIHNNSRYSSIGIILNSSSITCRQKTQKAAMNHCIQDSSKVWLYDILWLQNERPPSSCCPIMFILYISYTYTLGVKVYTKNGL